MDKFVVKTRQKRQRPQVDVEEVPRSMKQVTLASLKRVVVVEDILKSKATLSPRDQSSDVLLKELAKLRPKIPSVEVLKTTKLGKVLNRLTKHTDPRVAKAASNLVNSWKADIRERRTLPKFDVRCDAKTTGFRKEAKRSLHEAFTGKNCNFDSDEAANVAEEIERELFTVCEKRANEKYRRASRKIVFALRHRADLRRQIFEKKTNANTLVMAHIQK